jgi:hypothetical protein
MAVCAGRWRATAPGAHVRVEQRVTLPGRDCPHRSALRACGQGIVMLAPVRVIHPVARSLWRDLEGWKVSGRIFALAGMTLWSVVLPARRTALRGDRSPVRAARTRLGDGGLSRVRGGMGAASCGATRRGLLRCPPGAPDVSR